MHTKSLIVRTRDYMIIIIFLQSETERTQVVQVNKVDRSKLHKYSEFEPNGDLFVTFEFVTFEGVEPDSSVFQVPAECF